MNQSNLPQFFTATILEWKKLLKPDKQGYNNREFKIPGKGRASKSIWFCNNAQSYPLNLENKRRD